MPELKHSLKQEATILYARESNLYAMSTTYGERLDRALRMTGKDRLYLAAQIDISVQAISQVIAWKTKALTAENSARAARVLQVDGYWLATGEGEPQGQLNAPAANEAWPFVSLTRERFEAAPAHVRGMIEGRAVAYIEEWEASAKRANNKIA